MTWIDACVGHRVELIFNWIPLSISQSFAPTFGGSDRLPMRFGFGLIPEYILGISPKKLVFGVIPVHRHHRSENFRWVILTCISKTVCSIVPAGSHLILNWIQFFFFHTDCHQFRTKCTFFQTDSVIPAVDCTQTLTFFDNPVTSFQKWLHTWAMHVCFVK